VIYRGTRKGTRNLYWRAIDGSGEEERLTNKPDVSQTPTSISRDGRWLLFNQNDPTDPGGVSSWMLRLDGDRALRRLFPESEGDNDPQISPDGRWIAFQASVSSRQEIYVAPFPAAAPRYQVSAEGGVEPLWSRDGHELYFQSGARLMSVRIAPGAVLLVQRPPARPRGAVLSQHSTATPATTSPRRLPLPRIQQVSPARPITQLDLVLNWFQELKQGGER
jgi:dipeptidyl aminopeptidase/acylaminoacyl peptidase